jgi:hypothetical protein
MRPLSNKALLAALAASAAIVAVALWVRTHSTPAPVVAQENPAPASELPPQPVTETSPTDEKSQKILELFHPSEQALSKQLSETEAKEQIEQLLTTSFVLTTCNIGDSELYRNSFLAATVFAQRNNLASDQRSALKLVRDIAKASGASYALVYKNTKCDNPKLPTIAEQVLTWQKGYLTLR